jgi:lipoprotein-anchoring transpeptidase ErfK/SrfK
VLAAVAVLVALAPIIGGERVTSSTVRGHLDSGLTFIPSPVPVPKATPSAGTGALVAMVRHDTTMRVTPGGRTLGRLSTRTRFGSPAALLVTTRRGPWLGAVSPLAGNGRIGWIPRSAVALRRVNWEIKVSLSARRLTVIENGKPVERYSVAIGGATAPTPTGRFAVTDRLFTGNPGGPYGCCILALSAKSAHTIPGWSGGNRIAIHSTPDTATIGRPVSHGCLHVTLPEGRWLLGHIPLGTPAVIT